MREITPNRTILFSAIIGLLAALVAVIFLGPRLATKADIDSAIVRHGETAPHRDLQAKVLELEQRFERHIEVQEVDVTWTRAALVLLLEHQKLTLPLPPLRVDQVAVPKAPKVLPPNE